jgi:hypothetical protein
MSAAECSGKQSNVTADIALLFVVAYGSEAESLIIYNY